MIKDRIYTAFCHISKFTNRRISPWSIFWFIAVQKVGVLKSSHELPKWTQNTKIQTMTTHCGE